MNLAVSNFGDDGVTGQNGKVKTITDDLDDAGSVRNSAKFEGDENGRHHSNGEYGEENNLGLMELLTHLKYNEEGKSKSKEEQNSDRIIHHIYGNQITVLFNEMKIIVTACRNEIRKE